MGINWISFTVIFKIYLKIFLSKAINRLKEKKKIKIILPLVTGAEVGLKPLTFWMKRRVFLPMYHYCWPLCIKLRFIPASQWTLGD